VSTIPTLRVELSPPGVLPALVWGFALPGCPRTEATPEFLDGLLERVRRAGEAFLAAQRKTAVRGMLRYGKYKPAGRSKPSSEYLLAAALEGSFPLVSCPVDVNNAVSLECGYPASIFDLALCGPELLLRRGAAGESYVFNPSDQSIDLEDLVCVCRRAGQGWEPCGNPVKDAMATKVNAGTRDVAAVIYAPPGDRPALEAAAARYAGLLASACGARDSGWILA
jgi:DNA/RNA-binding domain of Phe-tRNA-synthetase-like protein